MAGKSWGRAAGTALAGVSLITQFMFIPYYPVWSIIVMTLDLVIVWLLSRLHPGSVSGQPRTFTWWGVRYVIGNAKSAPDLQRPSRSTIT
ncbi:hypothetical protein ABZ454_15135 [Streptomyces sp. NPDC005803]|uniref:DUF7144 family membrane protein n=1 Tax=Streptomyces sp. NPDC005803 TaxID=3154297 RepID=UPI0033FBEFDA